MVRVLSLAARSSARRIAKVALLAPLELPRRPVLSYVLDRL
jgi:hypothetical protein